MILPVVPQIDGWVGVMSGPTLVNRRVRVLQCQDDVPPLREQVDGQRNDLLLQERLARQRFSQQICL